MPPPLEGGAEPLLRSRPPSVSCLIPLADVGAGEAAAPPQPAAVAAGGGSGEAGPAAGGGEEWCAEDDEREAASPRVLPPAAAGASSGAPCHQHHQHPASDEDEQGDSSCGQLDSPARRADAAEVEAGYESSDDMDFLNARHCINCTGELWGSVCRVSAGSGRAGVLGRGLCPAAGCCARRVSGPCSRQAAWYRRSGGPALLLLSFRRLVARTSSDPP